MGLVSFATAGVLEDLQVSVTPRFTFRMMQESLVPTKPSVARGSVKACARYKLNCTGTHQKFDSWKTVVRRSCGLHSHAIAPESARSRCIHRLWDLKTRPNKPSPAETTAGNA